MSIRDTRKFTFKAFWYTRKISLLNYGIRSFFIIYNECLKRYSGKLY